MKKSILAILLSLVMVLSISMLNASSVAAAEAEGHTDHCVCGGGQAHDHETVTWAPWTGEWESGGAYYLTEDITDWTTFTVAEGQILNLCLNGHSITGAESCSRMLRIYGILNLCDHKQADDSFAGRIVSTYPGAEDSVAHVFYVFAGGTVNIYGGELSATGTAKYGAIGAIAGGTVKLYDGVITGGKATVNGGNLRITNSNSVFEMYGGKLTGGQAQGAGGNLHISAGKLRLYGGKITRGSASLGGGVYAGVNAYLDGSVQVAGNENSDLMLASGKKVVIQNALTEGASVGVDLEAGTVVTDAVIEGTEAFFFGSGDDKVVYNAEGVLELEHWHCLCGGTEDHVHTSVKWEPWTGTWESGKYYYLTEDITGWKNTTISAGESLHLCLNGHSITGTAARMFNIRGKLYLYDEKKTTGFDGKVISEYAGTASSQGHVFQLYTDAEFYMYGGELTAANPSKSGNIGVIQGGTMYLYDGVISGGNATSYGGNLRVIKGDNGGGTVEMYGGTISGGQTEGPGGNVDVYAGTFRMYGGTVTGGSGDDGGNIRGNTGTTVEILGGTVSNGTAAGDGGDLYIAGSGTVKNATVSGGNGVKGGSIYVGGSCIVENSTVETATGTTGRVLYIASGAEVTLKDAGINDLSEKGTCIWNVGTLYLEGTVKITDTDAEALDIMVDVRSNGDAVIDIAKLSGQDAAFKVRKWAKDENNANVSVGGLLATGATAEQSAMFRPADTGYLVYYVDGQIHLGEAAVVLKNFDGEVIARYATVTEALADVQEGNVHYALKQDVTGGIIDRDVLVDLSGFDWSGVTVAEGVEARFIDSANNNYDETEDFGKVTLTEDSRGTVAQMSNTAGYTSTKRYYVTYNADGEYSFHRYYAAVNYISLRPAQAALGYKATFRGDSYVKELVTGFGYNLWLENGSVKTFTMDAEAFDDGKVVALRLRDILSQNEEISRIGATANIYGNAFITFNNGGSKVSSDCRTSMKEVVETINESWKAYSQSQKTAVRNMVDTYAAYMTDWAIDNIRNWDGEDNSLKVLAIGNSFSVDAMEYFYQIAQNLGVEEVRLGNLYISGCTLEKHYTNLQEDNADYTYYTNNTGTWEKQENHTLKAALESQDWDIITMQQGSGSSGMVESYAVLPDLVAGVKSLCPNAQLVWHMTWAYQNGYVADRFEQNYGSDQQTMYEAILAAVQSQIVPNADFAMIIPVGTAVQNARSSYLGDNLTRDGYHLDKGIGRYIAGLTWVQMLTDMDISNVTWCPEGVTAQQMAVAIESVQNAIANPFSVTDSVYTEEILAD